MLPKMKFTIDLVKELSAKGNHREAMRAYFMIAGDEKETVSTRSWAGYLGAIEASELTDWELAIVSCTQAMRECPAMVELPWYAAYCASRAGDHLRAIAFAHMAIALADRQMPPTTYPSWMRHPPAWNEGPYDVLRFAYRSIGDDVRADWAEGIYRQLVASRQEETPFSNSLMQWRPEIQGWSADILPFYKRLTEERVGHFDFVEIGVFHGRSILFLAERLLEQSDELANLIAVDVNLSHFRLNAGRLTDRLPIESYELASVEAAKLIERDFDVVFIDAAHDYVSVKQDIEAWKDKVKPGGLLSVHDYMHAGEHADVGRAVDEMFGDRVLVEGSVWQVRRTENGWEHP